VLGSTAYLDDGCLPRARYERGGDVTGSPILLSHSLDEATPAYGGAEGVQIRAKTSIANGDTANTVELALPNHIGTHVDLPLHFFHRAASLTDYPPEAWVFRAPVLVDVEAGLSGLIEPDSVADIPMDADCLLLRTGHEVNRDGRSYWEAGPGLSADLGLWLRRERPSVRAVGMDLISVTSRLHREAGRAAHRAFLDPAGDGEPIRLIEDMALGGAPAALGVVLVSPLMLTEGDGAPVTVWAFPAP
jgi:arylformamidase